MSQKIYDCNTISRWNWKKLTLQKLTNKWMNNKWTLQKRMIKNVA